VIVKAKLRFLMLGGIVGVLLPCPIRGQDPTTTGVAVTGLSGVGNEIILAQMDVSLRGPDGAPLEGPALVTVSKMTGQIYRQATAKAGQLKLVDMAPTEYNIYVVAPGFARAKQQIDLYNKRMVKVSFQLEPAPEGEDAAADIEFAALAPKAQKEVGKAIEALQGKKPGSAKSHLDAAYRVAPKSAEVNYLFGVYSSQVKDVAQAKTYWSKAIEIYPKHYRALLSLSQAFLDEKQPTAALPLLDRAVKAEPSSWRAQAIMADAYLRQGTPAEAIKHAERSIELGHGQAAIAQRFLAAGLARSGEREKGIAVLQAYIKEHPADAGANKQLEGLQSPEKQAASPDTDTANAEMAEAGAPGEGSASLVSSRWLPPDIDEKIPPVEEGAACALDDVVKKAGLRIEELVANVDRFVATEHLSHETINKWGLAASPDTKKFDYMVSIREVKAGYFDVQEFRNLGSAPAKFPDGIETKGLPSLVLVFHPHYIGSFDMTCEGLAKWNGGLAWQVHFRQRTDKPNLLRTYQLGEMGMIYSVPLKGRAWIAADSYQVVRLETQMIAPLQEIRLAADLTVIEYGPVHFAERNLDMWLPQSAEVYSDWKGRRMHRRHSFNNFVLFSVDDEQKIGKPKTADDTQPKPLN
jgi:tetratricopeptide (TPR) repeat protein